GDNTALPDPALKNLGSVRSRPRGRDTLVRRLAAVCDLRAPRACDPVVDGRLQLRLRAAPEPPGARPRDAVRIGCLPGPDAAPALHRQLLPDGDALHPLRHRDRVPVPTRGDPPRARLVRLPRVPRLPRDPPAGVRLHLAEGGARVALDDRLSEL